MSEQELKLHVPASAAAQVEKALKKAKCETISLRAMYFDTADRELAKSKIAIRLRLEGENWVQTLKMPGSNALTKLELNHNRPSPVLDLSLYAGTPAEAALLKLAKPLELRYETNVTRVFRRQRTRKGTIEIAYDTGVIRAAELELPISEVEFELVSGSAEAIFEIGKKWLSQYKLILDLRSKSQRGDALAQSAANIRLTESAGAKNVVRNDEVLRFWAPRKARAYEIDKQDSATQALISVTTECLEQICANTGALAEIDTLGVVSVGRPEHVHQLRIGMRRLTSNWKLFTGLAWLPAQDVRDELRVHLGRFGATRDLEVMLATVVPVLTDAGMPAMQFGTHAEGATPHDIAKDPTYQQWLLRLLEWTVLTPTNDPVPAVSDNTDQAPLDVADDEPQTDVTPKASDETAAATASASEQTAAALTSATGSAPAQIEPIIIPLTPLPQARPVLRRLLEQRLNKWNRQIVRHWKTEDKSDIEAYHDLRKRIKRMRYALNVYEGLRPNCNLTGYVKKLAAAQEVFGHLNDMSTALTFFSAHTQTHPAAWFAVGWLTATIETLKLQADEVLTHIPGKIRYD
ncbi:CYTH and CHAD domain-containing protein [Advenella mimigardefordensis]|nr:CYTH and CHAD domain-containing protein [Advenella mimigardefordensis]